MERLNLVSEIIDRDDRVRREGLYPRPDRHRPLLQGLALWRRPVGQERAGLWRHSRARQRLFRRESAAAARRDHQRQSQGGAPGRSRDPEQIQEFVPHSWYKYPDETKGLHPWDGVTEPQLQARPERQGHADQYRGARRGRQIFLDQGAALARPRHGGRAARPLRRRLCAGQAGVQGADRQASEEARRAGDGAVLDARPHRGARARMPMGRRTRCAISRTS